MISSAAVKSLKLDCVEHVLLTLDLGYAWTPLPCPVEITCHQRSLYIIFMLSHFTLGLQLNIIFIINQILQSVINETRWAQFLRAQSGVLKLFLLSNQPSKNPKTLFTILNCKEKHQILTSEMEKATVLNFFCLKNDLLYFHGHLNQDAI